MPHTSLQLKRNKKIRLISIIIANYNGEEYLKTCLSSVLLSLYKNFEIIVIDDGSTDTSINIIKEFQEKDKRIVLVKNHKNRGAAASRNRAVKFSKGEILIFLDNDTEVDKQWIDMMLPEFNSDSKVGAVQSVLLDFQKRNLIQNAGVRLWAETGWGLPFYQWEKYNIVYEKLPNEIVAISAAIAVTKEAYLATRGFDEMESVVTEDLDLSWRLWVNGYKIKLARKSIVYHWTKGVEMRKNMKHTKRIIYFHLTKNSLTSILKNYEIKNAVIYFIYSAIISLGRAVLVLLRRGDAQALFATIQAFMWIGSNFSTIIEKRKYIQVRRKIKDDELFNTILLRGNPIYIYKNHFLKSELL